MTSPRTNTGFPRKLTGALMKPSKWSFLRDLNAWMGPASGFGGTVEGQPALRPSYPEAAMLETLQSLSLLTLLEIIGPIVLAAALIYGIYHSRRRRNSQPKKKAGTVYAQDN
jgi:hypothetical protein